MSRFVELLEMQAEPMTVARFRQMTFLMIERLDARSGTIELRFPYFVRKTAPVSGVESRLDYDVGWRGTVAANGTYSFWATVTVPVTSLCPCSKEISEYGAHNQRSHITIEAEVVGDLSIDELITTAEQSVAQAPDAMIFADRDGTIRVWNNSAERIFGYRDSEVIGGSLDVIIPERLRSAHWRGFRTAIETGHAKYVDKVLATRAVHKDGSKLYVDLSFALVRDEAGTVAGSLAIARDCTERYLSDSALRARVSELEQELKAKS
jgi:PAS domain S-box-containing protein